MNAGGRQRGGERVEFRRDARPQRGANPVRPDLPPALRLRFFETARRLARELPATLVRTGVAARAFTVSGMEVEREQALARITAPLEEARRSAAGSGSAWPGKDA